MSSLLEIRCLTLSMVYGWDIYTLMVFPDGIITNTVYITYIHIRLYVSGSSKTQTLLPSNVIEIAPQGFKFCNSLEKYQLLLGGNNVWILLEPLTYIVVPLCVRLSVTEGQWTQS